MDKALSMLGLAKRAGRITSGADMVEDAVRQGKAKLVIIASDAAKNSRKSISDCCGYYNVKILEYSDKEQLARAIGTDIAVAVAVNDEGLAKAIEAKITDGVMERKG